MKEWGKTKAGQQVHAVELSNEQGMKVTILTYGAILQSIIVPNREGTPTDVTLGYDTIQDYEKNDCFFGALVGPNANRIADAEFQLDGKKYSLAVNDNGRNNLHSGEMGFQRKVWNVVKESSNSVTLSVKNADGELGFPGNLSVEVTYTLMDDNELILDYYAVTDQDTVCNLTNHAYFNLDGHDSGAVLNQQINILADHFTPVSDSESIPTGQLAEVKDTPMDLRHFVRIGDSIDASYDQLQFAGGYDHNWVVNESTDRDMILIARAKAAKSGIVMEAFTDLPGVQFYTGNYIPTHKGKGGAEYVRRSGFCLETQFFPNAINDEHFESPVLKAGDSYRSHTRYAFHTEQGDQV